MLEWHFIHNPWLFGACIAGAPSDPPEGSGSMFIKASASEPPSLLLALLLVYNPQPQALFFESPPCRRLVLRLCLTTCTGIFVRGPVWSVSQLLLWPVVARRQQLAKPYVA